MMGWYKPIYMYCGIINASGEQMLVAYAAFEIILNLLPTINTSLQTRKILAAAAD